MSWRLDTGGSVEDLATQLTRLADEDFRDYSPLYERLSRQMAFDHELLARLVEFPDAKRLPVNLFAAVNFLVRREPDTALAAIFRGEPGEPWPAFREFVEEHLDEIVVVLDSRTIQTNEVGRCAALVPAFGRLSEQCAHRPLALLEIGASAGLNLLVDQYAVSYDDGRRFGSRSAAVQLSCALVGPNSPPLPTTGSFAIRSREGIDVMPVDVRDPDACAWLEACIWPDVPGRLERFRAAVREAQARPPLLHRGDALDLLGGVVGAVAELAFPIVFTTWALAYFDKAGRQRVHDVLAERGTRRDLALVTAEYRHVTPWVADPPRAPTLEGKGATMLSITTWSDGREHSRPVAWMQAHGQWLDWFADGEADV